MSTGTRPVTIAVIDAGVDITHPDLRDNIWVNPREIPNDGIDNDGNGYIDDVHGWNFVKKSPDVGPSPQQYQDEESWSHGTFVASILAAKGNNQEGIAGVNWNARIMSLVTLDGDGFGQTGVVVEAIRYAVNQGASVINLSLSGYEFDPALEEMIQRANNAGVVVVAATGNTNSSAAGLDIDRRAVYPVCMDGKQNAVLGVGGTDTLDQKSPYANYGQRCTDVSAPAQEFFAARPHYARSLNGVVFEELSTSTPGYLNGMTGTSLAAPLVSGVASLIKSVRPDATPDQIKSYIIFNSDRIEENLTPAQRGKMGSGRLNAARALQAAINAAPTVSENTTSPTSTVISASSQVFSYRSTDHISTWVITQKPLFSGWVNDTSSTASYAYILIQDAKGFEWRMWNPLTGKIQTHRLKPTGKSWKVAKDPTNPKIFRFTSAGTKSGYVLDVVTGAERLVRLP